MQQYFGIKKENDVIYINQDDLNHIKNVMRMKEHDKVIVVYENNSYICSLNGNLLSAKIEEVFKTDENLNDLILYIPVLPEDKMSFIIQKGTELGVTEFVIVEYSHCKFKLPKKDYEKKLLRWNKIAKEASEQCYRINKPVIKEIINIDNITLRCDVNILCSLVKNDVKLISEVLNRENCNDTISVAFGPEGGFSPFEEDLLIKKGFIRTSLGSNVLRTETVPIYIASVISYLKGSAK